MFRVECSSCRAAYQVDERRVPAKGLMMKCPKCRASFLVSPPDAVADPPKNAVVESVKSETTAPLPDVQAKPPIQSTASPFGDLPEPLKKTFDLPATRGRVRNDETMIGVAPSSLQAKKFAFPPTGSQSGAELPASRSIFDGAVGLPEAKAKDNAASAPNLGAELPARKPTLGGALSDGKNLGLPEPKVAERSSGPITPMGIRKVSRINLPSLPNKGVSPPVAPDSKREVPDSSEPSLPDVLGKALSLDLAVSPSSDDEFELPDVFGGKPKAKTERDELPIFGTSRQELPAVKVTSINDDLPAALSTSTASLPAVSVGRRVPEMDAHAAMDFSGLSLGDDDRPSQSATMADLDSEGVALETVPPTNTSGAADLPDLFGVDLPSIPVSASAKEDVAFEDAGLGFGELDLPALDNKLGDGPNSALSAHLPSFAPSDPPPAVTSSAPPSFRARQDSFGDFEGLPSFGETKTSTSQTMGAGSKRSNALSHDPFEEEGFSLGSSHETPAKSVRGDGIPPQPRAAAPAGSREYGQVALEESSGALDAEMDDEMEFGGIPQADSDPPQGAALSQKSPSVSQEPKPAAAQQAKQPSPREPAKPKSRRVLKWGALAAAIVVGGAALAVDPRIGPFGAFLLGDLLHRGEHQALLQQMEGAVNAARQNDQYSAIVTADGNLEQASNSAKRFAPLQTATATQHLATVLRFGGPSKAQSTAQVLLAELQALGVEPVDYATAKTINTILTQGPRTPEQSLQQLPNNDLLAQTVRAEYWLIVGDAKRAAEEWSKAVEMKRCAWTLFGLARAQFLGGQLEMASKQAAQVLELTKEHSGAALLMADAALQAGKYDSIKSESLTRIARNEAASSPKEVALAHTLSGERELAFGRVGKALEAFEAALAVQPNDTRALTSSGTAMLSSGRYAAALARFQAAKTADPRALAPALGEVRAQLELQQVDAAKLLIAALQRDHAKEIEVNTVQGAVALATGEVEAAKKVLLEAASASKNVAAEVAATPAFQRVAVETYVTLAAAYSRSGHSDQAAPILSDALNQLPKSSALRTALGDVALSQGQYDKALSEYVEAQKLAPNELEPVFKAGSVLRRLKRFEEATQAFDRVAQADPEYLGLPLERGLILEQSGNVKDALLQYEAALKHAPGELDVQLRVGCGRVVSGNVEGARQVLKDVLDKRPKSAEAAYCLGRALFAEGANLEALRWLRTAVDLDGNSAHYHLYLGWVASEAAQVALAQKELNRALALDPGLADAYWQRGVLNMKQGAARDAMLDFKKTLELKPDRNDANADMGQALSQLGKEKDAIPFWEKAIAAEPDNTTWLFRYGKLLIGRQQMAKGTELLQRAITLIGKSDVKPNWLWQAHYWTALGLGDSPTAVKHWREYLSLSSVDSPYRDEAKRALKRAGQVWDGD
jgi:cellulose synthase operon protein C